MFQPHSVLWHYLWVAPNLLLVVLASILWKQGLHKKFRGFYIYAWFQAVQWAVLYSIDLMPSVPAVDYWRIYWFGVLLESIVLFVLISDIFGDVFGSYAALARVGRLLIRWGGAFLLITATIVAAGAPIDNRTWLASTSQIMQEAMYIVVSGLVVLLFVSGAYFRLAWNRRVFGIALGLGITGCVHLATWAIRANFGVVRNSNLLDIANLATSHVVVLMWYYYLLVPQKVAAKSVVALPENTLALWNRELGRLLQQRPAHQ